MASHLLAANQPAVAQVQITPALFITCATKNSSSLGKAKELGLLNQSGKYENKRNQDSVSTQKDTTSSETGTLYMGASPSTIDSDEKNDNESPEELQPSTNGYNLTTEKFAEALNLRPQSIRKRYAQTGSYFGIVPSKLPNGRLRWPPDAIARLLKQEGKQ